MLIPAMRNSQAHLQQLWAHQRRERSEGRLLNAAQSEALTFQLDQLAFIASQLQQIPASNDIQFEQIPA